MSKQSEDVLASLLGASITDFGAPLPLDYSIPRFLGVLNLFRGEKKVTIEVFSNAIISSERSYVLGISPKKLGLLLLNPRDLISKQLFRFDTNHIISAILKLGNEEYTLSRELAGWRRKSEIKVNEPSLSEPLISYEEHYVRPGAFEKFLEMVQTLEAGESTVARPTRDPDGVVALSISKKPNILKSKVRFYWWDDLSGQSLIANGDSNIAHKVELNFESGVRSLLN